MVASALVIVLEVGLFLSTVIPLGISWTRSASPIDKRNRASLYIASLSLIWFVAAARFPLALGRYYSTLRYTVILANLLVMLACTVVVFVRKSRLRGPLGLACLILTVIWFLVAAIN
jgi:hypothetical protein